MGDLKGLLLFPYTEYGFQGLNGSVAGGQLSPLPL